MKASPLRTNAGYSTTDAGHWRTVVIVIGALLVIVLLMTQLGGARLKKEAEVALSRASQLLHEAERENRKVRPLPLSLAETEVGALTQASTSVSKTYHDSGQNLGKMAINPSPFDSTLRAVANNGGS